MSNETSIMGWSYLLRNELLNDISNKSEDDVLMKWSSHPFLSMYINETNGFTTPLIKAIQNNWIKVVVWLIDNGADVNIRAYYSSPLSTAVDRDISIFKYLVDKGADVTAYDWIIMESLIMTGNITIIKFLVDLNNSYIESMMNKLLCYEKRYHMIKIMRFLHTEQVRIAAMVFIDLPQYIILWITDWLPESDCLTEYEKIRFIGLIQESIRKVKKID